MSNDSYFNCPYCEHVFTLQDCIEAGEAAEMIPEDNAVEYCGCEHDDFDCPNESIFQEVPDQIYDIYFFQDLKEAFLSQDAVKFNFLINQINQSDHLVLASLEDGRSIDLVEIAKLAKETGAHYPDLADKARDFLKKVGSK